MDLWCLAHPLTQLKKNLDCALNPSETHKTKPHHTYQFKENVNVILGKKVSDSREQARLPNPFKYCLKMNQSYNNLRSSTQGSQQKWLNQRSIQTPDLLTG
jgi:hypothetical protein